MARMMTPSSAQSKLSKSAEEKAAEVHLRHPRLHIVSIRRFDSGKVRRIFQYAADLSRGFDCDGERVIELCVVPIHFGESEDFFSEFAGRLIDFSNRDFERFGYVHAGVGHVKIHASSCV
jgi:hypothetical protein